jgi:phosphate/sulfate permease
MAASDLGYIITIGVFSFLMSFSIGANDAANALATSYGSEALKLLYLVILGGIFEFIGAMFCSSHVAGNLVQDVIYNVDDITPEAKKD